MAVCFGTMCSVYSKTWVRQPYPKAPACYKLRHALQLYAHAQKKCTTRERSSKQHLPPCEYPRISIPVQLYDKNYKKDAMNFNIFTTAMSECVYHIRLRVHYELDIGWLCCFLCARKDPEPKTSIMDKLLNQLFPIVKYMFGLLPDVGEMIATALEVTRKGVELVTTIGWETNLDSLPACLSVHRRRDCLAQVR